TAPALTPGVSTGNINGGNGHVTISWTTGTGTPTPTPTTTPGSAATTTGLRVVQVPFPFGLGGIAVPITTVAPPNAAGTVQFRDATADLGNRRRTAQTGLAAGVALGADHVGVIVLTPSGTVTVSDPTLV
ncbi:MAG: hypothetical protein ACRDQH_02930, partial [Pseudonocardiaceae bacterium]